MFWLPPAWTNNSLCSGCKAEEAMRCQNCLAIPGSQYEIKKSRGFILPLGDPTSHCGAQALLLHHHWGHPEPWHDGTIAVALSPPPVLAQDRNVSASTCCSTGGFLPCYTRRPRLCPPCHRAHCCGLALGTEATHLALLSPQPVPRGLRAGHYGRSLAPLHAGLSHVLP